VAKISMKTWAYFQETRAEAIKRSLPSRGFTLLEMLVVLFIVGLTSVVVLPRLPQVADSFDFALKRQSFEQHINGLSYLAFSDGKDFVLAGRYDSEGRISGPRDRVAAGERVRADLRTQQVGKAIREIEPPLVVADLDVPLPDGWILHVPQPVYYRSSGYCSGGRAELIVGRLKYEYELGAPTCKIALLD